jgi:hypothetical protein
MTPTNNDDAPLVSVEEMQKAWHDLTSKVGQLELDQNILEQENKTLRFLIERVIEHRQKSHGDLVLILSNLVSKLPINEVGFIVSKLVEHNAQVSETLAALSKSKVGAELPQPAVLKVLDQTKRDLTAALKPLVEELIRLGAPLPPELLHALIAEPKLFFSPAVVRAKRGFIKGQLPRERIVKEFGEEALVFFNDMTTDAKLNPRPKPEEIALAFKADFETLLAQNPTVIPAKQKELSALHQQVQRSRSAIEQKNAFLKISFLLELLHYYESQGTESPDVLFAQRLPNLVEQLVLGGDRNRLDVKLIEAAESLLGFIINHDYRHTVVNNIGKADDAGKTLRFVFTFRSEKIAELDIAIASFIKHLLPPQNAPSPAAIAAVLKLIRPEMQRLIVRAIVSTDRVNREVAGALSRDLGRELGLPGLEEEIKAEIITTPEKERRHAWEHIHDLIEKRADPAAVTVAVRNRLHTKYDADEVKQSWTTLTETDPMMLVRTFCQLPYLADGTTDPIARAVMESYVQRLTHEKYADTYAKVVKSLTNMFKVKPDSPTLMNFITLVKWVDADAGKKLCGDIGMAAV